MTAAGAHPFAPLRNFFGSAKFAAALTLAIIGTAFSCHLIRSVMGWAGLVAIIIALVALAGVSLSARRAGVEWNGVLSLSVLAFVLWAVLSLFWTGYPGATLRGSLYLVGFGALAVYLALARDTIQIVRSVGDVLRTLLGLSLVLEVASGLLLDMPFTFLQIEGNIAELGPLQGVFGSRNELGFVALIALITFFVEWRTRSVQKGRATVSIVLATLMLLLSNSPVALVVMVAVAASALGILALRRASAEARWAWQIGLASAAVVGAVSLWLVRARVISALNAGSEFERRYTLWQELLRLNGVNPLEGWGFAGLWPAAATPYGWIEFTTGRTQPSALNAYLDVLLQLGVVGLILFAGMLLLAVVRAWLLATTKKSHVYVWPALVLIAITLTSLAESFALIEYSWLLLVVCAIKAAQDRSWRRGLRRHGVEPAPVPNEGQRLSRGTR